MMFVFQDFSTTMMRFGVYSADRGISIPSSRSATAVVTINVIDSEDEDPTVRELYNGITVLF